MNQPSSSTSSSEQPTGTASRSKTWRVLAWAIVSLILIDVGINIVFAYPEDVRDTNPGKLELFFDYGRSMEGRIRRMTRADPEKTAPITLAGWYRPLKVVDRPGKAGGDTVTVYGMSHAVRLADALHKVSPDLDVRSVGAPGATANWAYGAFRRDKSRTKSKAVVLAIMSSTVPMITSASPITWNKSFPLPYTQDRFVLSGGKLSVVEPPFDSFAGYVEALQDRKKWDGFMRHLARHDPFYDPKLLKASPLDHSAMVRMARRAWGNARDRDVGGRVLTAQGFDKDSEAIRLANAIVSSFAADARRDGIVPVIYIVNNYGYNDQLYRALRGTLEDDDIPFISSHAFVDPANPGNYLPDTHFTDANDQKLATALTTLIAKQSAMREPAR